MIQLKFFYTLGLNLPKTFCACGYQGSNHFPPVDLIQLLLFTDVMLIVQLDTWVTRHECNLAARNIKYWCSIFVTGKLIWSLY
jgi:hypothetical protein